MNPQLDDAVVRTAYADDESAAAAEYGAEFRRDIEAFLTREAIDACVDVGCRERPRWRTCSTRPLSIPRAAAPTP
jgi:hypothetical protein